MAIEITVPRLGWSMEEGTFSAWLRENGEKINAGEPLFAVESDKVIMDVESLDSGILHIPEDSPQPGASVKPGQLLGYLLAAGEGAPVAKASAVIDAPAVPQPAAAAPVEPVAAHTDHTPVTPRARRVARELGVDTSALRGSGRGGRIRERDVRAASAKPTESIGIPISSLRRTIADRMMRSHRETAPVTLTCRADATQLVNLRDQWKLKGGEAPSYTDIAVKLVAIALGSHPTLGGRWEGDRIALPEAIHIGIAVDTEHGLLVPVIRSVPELTLAQVARRSRELIAAAHSRRIAAADLEGGVFTVSNLGAFGIEAFTPIINVPETAVLGLGAIRWEAVALGNGHLATRQQIALSLTFDHRVVDGAPAARFLQALARLIERPGI
jgi:pyruvate dehydrogenase E2 component (dihydrolipoamide acetyltransferase)